MSRYHWVSAGIDTTWFLSHGLTDSRTIALPAGAILKKFLVRDVAINAISTGVGYNSIAPILAYIDVHIASGVNVNRVLFHASFAIPLAVTSLYDPLTAQRVYTAYHTAGDREIGVNQKCSYGHSTDPAWSVNGSLNVTSSNIAGIALLNSSGHFGWNLDLLYYL